MLTTQTNEFMQTVMLAIPAIMAVLHIPLAFQWLWPRVVR
jgi:hypothetical protein